MNISRVPSEAWNTYFALEQARLEGGRPITIVNVNNLHLPSWLQTDAYANALQEAIKAGRCEDRSEATEAIGRSGRRKGDIVAARHIQHVGYLSGRALSGVVDYLQGAEDAEEQFDVLSKAAMNMSLKSTIRMIPPNIKRGGFDGFVDGEGHFVHGVWREAVDDENIHTIDENAVRAAEKRYHYLGRVSLPVRETTIRLVQAAEYASGSRFEEIHALFL